MANSKQPVIDDAQAQGKDNFPTTISWREVREPLFQNPEFSEEYRRLQPKYDLARAVIELRSATHLNQRDFADLVGMKQSAIARIESGAMPPKFDTLQRIAAHTGYTVEVILRPGDSRQKNAPTGKLADTPRRKRSLPVIRLQFGAEVSDTEGKGNPV
jgi:transcriptional regulator with XRE-family HTH domain